MRLPCWIGLVGVVYACPAFADGGSCNQPNQREATNCLSEALSAAKDTLKRYDTAAEQELKASAGSSNSLRDFTAASAYWTRYRDEECAAVADQFLGGTAGVPLYIACATGLTKARTHEVWVNFLKPIGGGLPLLPEPENPALGPG